MMRMKTFVTTLTILCMGAFAQEAKTVLTNKQIMDSQQKKDILRHGPDVVQDLEIRECWVAPQWPETEIFQPTEVHELPNGTIPLSKDLPFVHTIRGYTYTYEHLRYSVR